MNQFFGQIFKIETLYIVLAYLVTIMLHEMAHGFAAYRLGDPTAHQAGRLSLNPLRHIDPIGLLMLIVFRFGWAKPVRVNMRYFKKPRRDFALTALAGPVMNFLIALVFAGILKAGTLLFTPVPDIFLDMMWVFISVSVGLGLKIHILSLKDQLVFLPIQTYWTDYIILCYFRSNNLLYRHLNRRR